MSNTTWISRLLVFGFMLAALSPGLAQNITVAMGTEAPRDSPWYQVLEQMGQEWRKLSGGKINLRIYPGVMGTEVEMIRKVRIGQLQAVAISGATLNTADQGVSCLQIPMLIESYAELDYVRDRIAPKLEERLRQEGFVVLNWGDVGWVHFFAKRPIRTLGEVRKLKLFTSAGDAEAERLYKDFGFQPVPLALSDMIMALQTGMIEAFDIPPLFALLNQSFGLAKNMIDVKWAPLVGATLISRKTWERIPAELQPELMRAARQAGDRMRGDIRRLGEQAVTEMQKRGLKVIELDGPTLADWRAEARAAYPKLRGTLVPADLFDEVMRLHEEFQTVSSARR